MFTWLVLLWLVYKTDEGCNWARITYLVLFLLGVPFYIRGMLYLYSYSIILDGASLARLILEIIALVMLFTHEARPWFHPAEADLPTATDDTSHKT